MVRFGTERDRGHVAQTMLEALGVSDARLADELRAAGFTASTVRLVHSAPLVRVAWADGTVTEDERRRIRDAAADDGVADTRASEALLERWLTERPPDHVLRASLKAVIAWLWRLAPAERLAAGRRLLERCQAVARASGSQAGAGAISRTEHEAIDEIATLLAAAQRQPA